MKARHYALLVFLGGCCYGILSTFVKLAYSAGFSLAEVTGGQFIFGTILIWLLVLFTRKKRISLNQAFKLTVSGVPLGLTGVLYYQALETLNASLAIIFLFQFVWIGTLMEWFLYKKKPTKEKIVSIIILLIGSLLASGALLQGNVSFTVEGAVWGGLAAISFATFLSLSSSVGKDIPPVLKSAILSTGGLLVVCILFPPVFLFDIPTFTGVMGYGVILGVFGVALPPLLFSIGMPKVGPGLGTILTASELPVAVVMSFLVLHEEVRALQWIGVGIILCGIVIGNSKKKHRVQASGD
ncbi:DMT family transporter [Rossellomorea sp. DA94]|uniref:EamA family transporter n=1 Tax=Rossellomorea sp. DA94 TaxID=3038653 RepID=UPI00244AD706|nr:DMT family transporter [Rossellomorea sp. DA94]WGG46397.1 DMT family transporter [Rossellomorea sp. DA94]